MTTETLMSPVSLDHDDVLLSQIIRLDSQITVARKNNKDAVAALVAKRSEIREIQNSRYRDRNGF
jgi:hypothetical protein